MINCVTIDDEPLALKQMQDYIEKTPFLNLIAKCESAFEAMEVLSANQVDLMFIDINMPDLSGMDFVKSMEYNVQIIFTTAYSEYAIEGFKVNALDYLLKPVSYNDFLKSANKAKKYFDHVSNKTEKIQSDDEHLFIKSEYKTIRINLSEIKYIEGMREYVRIHLIDSKNYMTLLSMKSLEKQLSKNQFMRVHRSFIVNLKQINVIERNRIVFDNNVYIPVSEQYKAQFQSYVDKSFLG